MTRAYSDSCKFHGKTAHRQKLAKYYSPLQMFNRGHVVPVYFHPDSVLGYQLAKAVYWNERYRPKEQTPQFTSQWNIQGAA